MVMSVVMCFTSTEMLTRQPVPAPSLLFSYACVSLLDYTLSEGRDDALAHNSHAQQMFVKGRKRINVKMHILADSISFVIF